MAPNSPGRGPGPAAVTEAAPSPGYPAGGPPSSSRAGRTTAGGRLRTLLRPALSLATALLLPVLLYYLLRAAGANVYFALLVTSAVSAAPSAVQLIRRKRVNRIASYFAAMSEAALLISLLPGSAEFLLAKGAVLTAVTGVLFLLSLRAETRWCSS